MSGTLRTDDPWSVRPRDRPGQFRETPHPRGSLGEEPEDRFDDDVDDAYRVADENMRQGQRSAGPRTNRGYDWRSSGNGSAYGYQSAAYGAPYGYGYQGYNSPFGYGYAGRPTDGLLEQMMRTYMDLMGVVSTMVNGFGRPPVPPYPRPYDRRREPTFRYSDSVQSGSGRAAAVRIEVSSNQAHQVALDLKTLQPKVSLSVPPLRALNNGKPELHDIRFETENDRYLLRIRIPDGQPAGLYSGVIVDARTGQPCGTLAIQVGRSVAERAGRERPAKKS